MTVQRDLRALASSTMAAHWRASGWTVPHAGTYPFRWLWDSCFHAIVWAELGEPGRARSELAACLAGQHRSGFVAHIDYAASPEHHRAFWGRSGTSTITQPPMVGHAVAELARRGMLAGEELAAQAAGAARLLGYWFERRLHPSGLVAAVHPWETGCDDSARFDHWGAADPARWFEVKGALVASLVLDEEGGAVANPAFDCAPAGLSALVAWNARELAAVAPDAVGVAGLAEPAGALAEVVAARWDPVRRTYADAGEANGSGRARTLEGLLPLLVEGRDEVRAAVLADLADPGAYGAPFGPRGAHPEEPSYEPGRYWRGGTWPQLAYLLWRAGARSLAEPTAAGALASGLAEHWHPDTAAPGGAVPQSWTALALLLHP